MQIDLQRIMQAGKFFSRDGAMVATRMLVGLVLGASSAAPLPVLIGVGLAIVGVTALAHMSIEKRKQHELLDLYREEISEIIGKDKTKLTVDDLKQASVMAHAGGKGSKALRLALDYFRDTRNFYITTQAVTAGLVCTGMHAAYLGLPEIFSVFGLAGASSLLYNEMFNSVKQMLSLFTEGNIRGTITHDIKQITREISGGGRISSTRVMGLVAQANPEIAKSIQAKYGQPYHDLSIADKRAVVDQYDAAFGVVDIARKVNLGQMLPTEMAFKVFGESSGVALRPSVPEMHDVETAADAPSWAEKMSVAPSVVSSRNPEYTAALKAEQALIANQPRVIH